MKRAEYSRLKEVLRVKRESVFLAFAVLMGTACLAFFTGPAFAQAESQTPGEMAGSEASSDETAQKNKEGWGLEFGVGFVLHVQDMEASASADFDPLTNPADPPEGDPLNISNGTSDWAIAPGFSLDMTVLSPPLFEAKYAPRVFFQIGYQNLLEDSFTGYRDFQAGEGAGPCGVSAEYPNPGGPGAGTDNALYIPSTASCDATTASNTSIQDMWYLGVGFQVPVPIFEDRAKFRLSFDYLGQKWGPQDFSFDRNSSYTVCYGQGAFIDPNNNNCVRPNTGPGPPTRPGLIQIDQTKESVSGLGSSLTTHALGIGLKGLVDVYEWRGLKVRLFLETRFAWLLNDYEQTGTFETDLGSFNSTIRPSEFIAQGGGGVRVYWSPF